MRVRGFADLSFEESAGLSLARAVERAATDPMHDRPEAWIVEERRISFSFEGELLQTELAAHRRILEELCREASSGEARLEPENSTRWEVVVAPAKSTAPRAEESGIAGSNSDIEMNTIPTGTRGA